MTITELERKTLITMFADGFAFDDYEDTFICWGVEGKQERACLTTLGTKGIIRSYKADGDTYVICGKGWTKNKIAQLLGFKDMDDFAKYLFE